MTPYILLFAFFALGAFFRRDLVAPDGLHWTPPQQPGLLLAAGAAVIALMIGLRFEIGADWFNYERIFAGARSRDLAQTLLMSDPGYQFLNWLVYTAGLEMWGVNLLCGMIFAWGLYRFARAQPEAWLAMVIAIPYLVTVIAMGYTRQAVAIGILMAGLAAVIQGGSVLRFAFYVGVAALFHKTAILVLPLVAFAGERNRLLNLLAGAASFYFLYDLLLADSVEGFVRNYVGAKYDSQGAAIRVLMSLVPSLLFLSFQDRFGFHPHEKQIWRYFSFAAIGFLIALLVSPSSTAVDRMALYIFPLQLAVLSRVPIAFPGAGTQFAVILYSLAIQLVWLLFAVHAQYWLPYQLFPF